MAKAIQTELSVEYSEGTSSTTWLHKLEQKVVTPPNWFHGLGNSLELGQASFLCP